VAGASIGVAPYQHNATTFSRFADPGKLKAYLAAGLPILLTEVPPNADELVAVGGAEIAEPTGACFAERIDALLADTDEWRRRRARALDHRRQFDWADLFDRNLPTLGFDTSGE
jgi:glycosyltransferase involved in cell wall biosynthesis